MASSMFGGIHPASRKENTRRKPLMLLEHPPAQVALPLAFHGGPSSLPLVKAGERVYAGQPIARPEGEDGAVLHACVSGRVEAIRYFPGKFFNAALDKASTDNERCAYLVRDDGGRSWVMVQVAGLIARRIVCRVEEGDTLARGERYGMIRFGSRVDLYLPPDYSAVVANGDVVAAGESILARKFQA